MNGNKRVGYMFSVLMGSFRSVDEFCYSSEQFVYSLGFSLDLDSVRLKLENTQPLPSI